MRILTLSILLLPLLAWGQDDAGYSVLGLTPELMENANSVIRNQEISFSVKSPGEARLYEKLVVTILNEKSTDNRLVLASSPSRKIEKIKGKIYDALGQLVRNIKKDEVRVESAIPSYSIYQDDKYNIVEVNYKTYPYTVEFEFSIHYSDLMSYPDWKIQWFNTSVQNSVYTLVLPKNLDVSYKALNTDIKPLETNVSGLKTLEWTTTNLPAIPYEPYCPRSTEILPQVLISPHTFEIEGYTGSMESWQAYGQFMNKLMAGRDELSPAMKAKVEELTGGLATDSAKIEALYRFMQHNLRYVSIQLGIGGYQPFSAKYVEEKKYGDCKALSNFMKSLLTEAGITSYPVLIYNGDMPYEITQDFTLPSFNHMILYVPSDDIWLECTSNTYPVNYIGASNAGRNVLLLTKDGGKMVRTPELPPVASCAIRNSTVKLKSDGSATVEVQGHYTGKKHEWFRYAKANLPDEECRKEFQQASSLPGFKLEKLEFQPSQSQPSAEVSYTAQVARFGSKAGKRLFVPANATNPFGDVPPAIEKRRHPVVSKETGLEVDSITLLLPRGYKVESMPPENLTLDSDYGHYHLNTVVEPGKIILERRFERHSVSLPATEYFEWRSFLKEVAKADGIKIVLVAE